MLTYAAAAAAAAHTNLTFLLREVLGRCLSLSLRRLQLPQLCDAHGNVPALSLSLSPSLSFSLHSQMTNRKDENVRRRREANKAKHCAQMTATPFI